MFKGAHAKLHHALKNYLSPHKIEKRNRLERRVYLQLEELETRALLSATVTPLLTVTPEKAATTSGPVGYTPSQIQQAYGITGTGAGQTIAIVDFSYDPNIASDVAAFDKQFNLPAINLTIYDAATGQNINSDSASQKSQLGENTGWAMETALDVEWAHSIAPNANIVLVEAPLSSNLNGIENAVNFAAGKGQVVSMSWGLSEGTQETSLDQVFKNNPNVAFVASSGDSSAFAGPIWPATSPYVLAIGGTNLSTTTSGSTTTYKNETGWADSGGGYSSYEGEPSFQTSTLGTTNARMTPDVAFDANPSTGVAVYDSFRQSNPWLEVGGTSVGSPVWSGIVALADQAGSKTLNTYQVETTLYNTTLPSTSSAYGAGQYSNVFHDITSGYNGYYAGKGYDLVTGLGSPIVNNLVPLLAGTTVSPTIPSNFITGSGTAAFYGSSFYGFAAVTAPGGGLYNSTGSIGIAAGSEAPTGNAAVPALPSTSAFTAPVGTSSVGTSTNTNGSLFVSFNTASPGLSSIASPFLANTASPSLAQNNALFGATGVTGSPDSWRLSSWGLNGAEVEQLATDLLGWLAPDGDDSALTDDGAPITDSLAGDFIALDNAPPVLIEADAGSSGGDD